MRGKFITFEGTEGAGKSTQIRLLADRLRGLGNEVVLVREPGGTSAGERIRDVLKDPNLAGQLSPEAELLLVSASRTELVRRVIRPALEEGKVVLCDRYIDSTFAYQGYGRELDQKPMADIVAYSIDGILPDATLLLDIPLATSLSRRAEREKGGGKESATDRFEQSGNLFFIRVEEGFRALAKREPDRIHLVDGVGDPKDVSERIWQLLAGVLE
jgi:dTMP kinase